MKYFLSPIHIIVRFFSTWLVVWVLWYINLCRLFNAKSIKKNQFNFKQFSLASVHGFIVKTFLFQAIQFIQTVLIQLIQFSMSIDFFTHS